MFYVKVLRNMAQNWSLFAKSVTAHQVLLALENVDGFASMNFDVVFIKSFKDKAIFRSLNFYYPIFLLAKGTYAQVNTLKEESISISAWYHEYYFQFSELIRNISRTSSYRYAFTYALFEWDIITQQFLVISGW